MKILKTLCRIYTEDIEQSILFYEKLTSLKCASRFDYGEAGLELAVVGDFLIISGSEETLRYFKGTDATVLVDSVEQYRDFLIRNGAVIQEEIKHVPTGWNMLVWHKDNTVLEYVEHRKS